MIRTRRLTYGLSLGLAVAIITAGGAAAQETGAAAATPATPAVTAPAPADTGATGGGVTQGMTWNEIMQYGGWLMYVLFGLSFLGITLILYFLVVLRVGQIAPRALHREIVEGLRSGHFDEIRRTCEYKRCPLTRVALAGLGYIREMRQTVDPVLLKDVMEGEGSRQAEAIQGQTQYLLDVAAVAPMVGLLGTVFGMLRAFGAVARDIASAKPVILAAGVSQALITTAFGLMIGIPAMMFYAFFRRRAAKLTAYLESASTDVLTALVSGELEPGQGKRKARE